MATSNQNNAPKSNERMPLGRKNYAMMLIGIAIITIGFALMADAITAELERLHSHLLWLGIACHIIGHDSMFMHIWDEREIIMDLLEKLSGNRVNYAMVTIGGARRDVDDDLRRELTANISHDLRTPLTMIKAYAEMVRDLSGDIPEKREKNQK